MTINKDVSTESLKSEILVKGTVEDKVIWGQDVIDDGHKTIEGEFINDKLYFEFKERYPTELDYLLEVKNISRSDESARYEKWRWNIGRFLNEACINGGNHGNKMQADKLLTIRRHYGEFGVLYEVEDEGEGFNVGKMIETFIKWKEGKIKFGEPSYHSGSGGTGSVLFDFETNNIVTYNQKGNIIYFQYLLQSQKPRSD